MHLPYTPVEVRMPRIVFFLIPRCDVLLHTPVSCSSSYSYPGVVFFFIPRCRVLLHTSVSCSSSYSYPGAVIIFWIQEGDEMTVAPSGGAVPEPLPDRARIASAVPGLPKGDDVG
jgi:hypothetical protein